MGETCNDLTIQDCFEIRLDRWGVPARLILREDRKRRAAKLNQLARFRAAIALHDHFDLAGLRADRNLVVDLIRRNEKERRSLAVHQHPRATQLRRQRQTGSGFRASRQLSAEGGGNSAGRKAGRIIRRAD